MQLTAIAVFTLSPWVIVSWRRLPYYLRLYAQENYSNRRYYDVLAQHKAENRYFQWLTMFIVAFTLMAFFVAILLMRLLFFQPVLTALGYAIVAFLLLYFAPRVSVVEPALPVTARAKRLRITAYFVLMFPLLLAFGVAAWSYVAVTDPNNSPESMIIAPLFLGLPVAACVIAGPAVFMLSRHAPVLAKLLNWPIERILNRI